jgi:hypothetical protein
MAGVCTLLDRENLTCRAVSLDCSEWSEEKDAGRARLDRVEGGDSRRTGPSRTTIQDVLSEVGHAQTTVTEPFCNDSLLSFIRIESNQVRINFQSTLCHMFISLSPGCEGQK